MKTLIINIHLNGINITAAPDPEDKSLTIVRVPVGPKALDAMNLHLSHIGVVPIEIQIDSLKTLAIVRTNDYQAGLQKILTTRCLLAAPFGQTDIPRAHPLATLPLFRLIASGAGFMPLN